MRLQEKCDEVTLSAQLDRHNTLAQLSFTAPADSPWTPWLTAFCQEHRGRDLAASLTTSPPPGNWPGPLFLPLWLLRWMGQRICPSPPHDYLAGEDPAELVCRCFGVYRGTIEQVAGEGASLKEITDRTLAGGACTTCLPDIKKLTYGLRPEGWDKMQRALRSVFPRGHFTWQSCGQVGYRGPDPSSVFPRAEQFLQQNFGLTVSLVERPSGSAEKPHPAS